MIKDARRNVGCQGHHLGRGGGNDTIGAGRGHNLINLGSGNDLVQSSGYDTIHANSGAVTVEATIYDYTRRVLAAFRRSAQTSTHCPTNHTQNGHCGLSKRVTRRYQTACQLVISKVH